MVISVYHIQSNTVNISKIITEDKIIFHTIHKNYTINLISMRIRLSCTICAAKITMYHTYYIWYMYIYISSSSTYSLLKKDHNFPTVDPSYKGGDNSCEWTDFSAHAAPATRLRISVSAVSPEKNGETNLRTVRYFKGGFHVLVACFLGKL